MSVYPKDNFRGTGKTHRVGRCTASGWRQGVEAEGLLKWLESDQLSESNAGIRGDYFTFTGFPSGPSLTPSMRRVISTSSPTGPPPGISSPQVIP
jgi:hypothetical protein